MLKQLQNAIRKHHLFFKGCHVLVAVSGGADSVALLCALHELARGLGIRLTAAHLNHRIRGLAADRDARFVRQLACRLKLPVIVGRIDVPRLARKNGFSLEMAARKARYDFLAGAARRVKADVIATAHTADDQAETVLLKLVRGAGAKGLAGIPRETTLRGVAVVRPMLDLPRTAIESFLREKGESWCEDETNRDESFQRNKVRHRILPLLESELNPRVRSALRRTADILREEDRWLDALAAPLLAMCRSANGALNVPLLRKQGLAARRRILRLWLAVSGVPAEGVDFDAMDRMERLLAKKTANAKISMAGDWTLARQHDELAIRLATHVEAGPYRKAIRIPGETVVKDAGVRIIASLAPGLIRDTGGQIGVYPARASLRRETLGKRKLTARSWRPGDRMRPFGMKGSKKIQDIFVDEKVPLDLRGCLPLLACGDEIIWLPGYRVSQGWEVDRASTPQIQIRVERLL